MAVLYPPAAALPVLRGPPGGRPLPGLCRKCRGSPSHGLLREQLREVDTPEVREVPGRSRQHLRGDGEDVFVLTEVPMHQGHVLGTVDWAILGRPKSVQSENRE